jgi:hypothetical protein
MPPFAELAVRPPIPERKPDQNLHHCIGVAVFVQAEVERGPNVCTLGSQSCQAIRLARQRGSPCLREGAAGVDRQDHACDVTRFVGGQEQYCVGDFDRVNPGDR